MAAEFPLNPVLLDAAKAAGFPLASLIDVDRAIDFVAHYDRYKNWVNAGFHAEMKYLERGLERRGNPKLLLPSTESLLCLAIPYRKEPPAQNPKYARYLQGHDYHEKLKGILEAMMKKIADDWNPRLARPLEWKVCVDTSAVLERSWAALAGLGWIGKNTVLIHPQYGSYLFLAEVLLNVRTGEGAKPLKDYCGNCTRCLNACPTGALPEPHLLNSNDCIAYLTLEKRGDWEKTEEFKQKMGTWIAGCDLCQEVCPFNTKPAKTPETWEVSDADRASLETNWEKLRNETEADYKARILHSSLERVKYVDMKRNIENAWKNFLSESN